MSIPLSKKVKRRRIWGISAFLFLSVVIICGAAFYGQLGPANPEDGTELVLAVENGATPGQIAAELETRGIIKDARSFLLYARLQGQINLFKAGEYLLSPALTVPEIIEKLVKGRDATMTFTIPEGYNLRQIAQVLVKDGLGSEEEFWTLVREGDFNYEFIKDLPKDETRLEGYLFPDTYKVPKGISLKKTLDLMLKRFDQVYNSLPPNQTDLTMREIVTLASLIEAESRVDEDRPLIASVFLNRLHINMKLDSDATVQYLFDERKERVLYKDLEIDSPYNTYRNKGLPPGPICSPGKASLRAALEPASTKYYYFVAKKDSSGEHVFSSTLAEHNKNKKKLGY